jgi:hypothetical protein
MVCGISVFASYSKYFTIPLKTLQAIFYYEENPEEDCLLKKLYLSYKKGTVLIHSEHPSLFL